MILFTFRIKELHGIDDNLRTFPLISVFVFPLVCLQLSFDKERAAFFAVLGNQIRLFIPEDEPVPFRFLLIIPGFIFVKFGGGKTHVNQRCATGCRSFLRILPEIAD